MGDVTVSETRRNPNTTRNVTVYVWALDEEGIKQYFRKVLKEEAKKRKSEA